VETSPEELMMVGLIPVPVGESGTPVPATVVLDGKGKGGVLFNDKEIVLLDQKIGSVGVIIDTKISVYVLVMSLPDIVVSVICSVLGNGDVTVTVPFKLLVAPLILASVWVYDVAVRIVELAGP